MTILRDEKGRFVKNHTNPLEWRKSESERMKGNKYAAGSSHRKGLTLEEEYGKSRATKIRNKISRNARWKGKIPPNLEIAQANSPIKPGKENINWKDEVQDEYGYEFTKSLKKRILKRDNSECQICHKENYKKGELVVHHIDEDKKNNSIDNLITLCRHCHLMVHHGTVNIE